MNPGLPLGSCINRLSRAAGNLQKLRPWEMFRSLPCGMQGALNVRLELLGPDICRFKEPFSDTEANAVVVAEERARLTHRVRHGAD